MGMILIGDLDGLLLALGMGGLVVAVAIGLAVSWRLPGRSKNWRDKLLRGLVFGGVLVILALLVLYVNFGRELGSAPR